MKKLLLTLCAVFICVSAFSQATELASKNGLVISYVAEKISAEKKSDKWKLTVTLDNTTGGELYFRASTSNSVTMTAAYSRLDIPNAKGLMTTNLKYFNGPLAEGVTTAGGGMLFKIPAGKTEEVINTSVATGATPEVKASFVSEPKTLAQINEPAAAATTATTTPAASTTPANAVIVVVMPSADGRAFVTNPQANPSDNYEEHDISYINWENKTMGATYSDGEWGVGEGGDFSNVVYVKEINYLDFNKAKMTLRVAEDEQHFLVGRNGNFAGANERLVFDHIASMGKKLQTALKPNMTPTLPIGKKLKPRMSLTTGNYAYSLLMQGDGNLVLFNNDGHKEMWSTKTAGKSGAYAEMQVDGNLVLKTAAGAVVWSSNTSNKTGAVATVTEEGQFIVATVEGKVLWQNK